MLKWWGKEKIGKPVDFVGGRNCKGMLGWVRKNTKYPWVEVEEEE